MGLSKEERFAKIAWGINRLHTTYKEEREFRLKEDSYLLSLLEKLWPAFLGTSSNPLFWVIGSAMNQTHQNGLSLFSLMLIGHKRGERDDEHEEHPLSVVKGMTDIGTLINDARGS